MAEVAAVAVDVVAGDIALSTARGRIEALVGDGPHWLEAVRNCGARGDCSSLKVGSEGEHSDARSSLVDEAITRTVSPFGPEPPEIQGMQLAEHFPAKAEWDRD
jgi:hypothetical protein